MSKIAIHNHYQKPARDEESTNEKIRRLYKSWVAGGQKPTEAIGELADNFGVSEQQVKKIVGR